MSSIYYISYTYIYNYSNIFMSLHQQKKKTAILFYDSTIYTYIIYLLYVIYDIYIYHIYIILCIRKVSGKPNHIIIRIIYCIYIQ